MTCSLEDALSKSSFFLGFWQFWFGHNVCLLLWFEFDDRELLNAGKNLALASCSHVFVLFNFKEKNLLTV